MSVDDLRADIAELRELDKKAIADGLELMLVSFEDDDVDTFRRLKDKFVKEFPEYQMPNCFIGFNHV